MNKKRLFEQANIVSDIISFSGKDILANKTKLVNVNNKGFYFQFKKNQASIPQKLFDTKLLNNYVELFLSEFELPFEGIVRKITLIRKDIFEIHIGFTEDTPIFYRECVTDLMN